MQSERSADFNKQIIIKEDDLKSNMSYISSISNKKVVSGFREALRKIDTTNDKMTELMNIKEEQQSSDDLLNQSNYSYLARDVLNYTEGNRELSDSRTELDKENQSEFSNNIRVINKNFKKEEEVIPNAIQIEISKAPILSRLERKNN